MQVADTAKESGLSGSEFSIPMPPEDVLRAQIYRLLAGFLSLPPDNSRLKAASDLVGDDSEFGAAIGNFARIAGRIDVETADVEFHDLFIGVTRGELLPYGSYYQTGFLNEKPLANLRKEMARQGIERIGGLKDPEDHIASILEMMAGLIEGAYGDPVVPGKQKKFFEIHVNSWASHFFRDLEAAEYSVLYAPLGTIGRLFMKIEQDAFAMC